MSWLVSAGAVRDEALAIVRKQLETSKGNYLAKPEAERADEILAIVEDFAKSSVAETDVLNIGAWGSESTIFAGTADPGRIVSIQCGYNVTVERPVPAPAPQADSPAAA